MASAVPLTSKSTSTSTPRGPLTPRKTVGRRRNTIDGSPSSASSTPRKLKTGGSTPVKTLLTIEQFQARHAAYFSHLHGSSQPPGEGAGEGEHERWLEEERRVGREKRARWEAYLASGGRSLGAGAGGGDAEGDEGDKENRPASVAGERSAWRPLSLLSKRTMGHMRSASHDVPLRPLAQLAPLGESSANVQTKASPVDLFTPTSKSVMTPLHRTARPAALDVVVESSPVPSPSPEPAQSLSPEPEVSGAKSTYSWATEFSGETAELRTAAEYVKDQSFEEEEFLDSPTKVGQRRKRIVALAHTVRQLEGVGSREEEDPGFYQVLVKAWHGRNDDHAAEAPPTTTATTAHNALTDAPPPFLMPRDEDESLGPGTHFSDPTITESETSTTLPLYNRSSASGSPGFINSFSPAEASIITPAMPDIGILPSLHAAYPPSRLGGGGTAQRTSSVRYSYASTLHDLALETGTPGGDVRGAGQGGGAGEKKWMKSRAADGRWSNMFNPRPPEDFFPPGHMRPPSIAPRVDHVEEEDDEGENEEDEVEREMMTPGRTLRKYATDIPVSRPLPPGAAAGIDPGATPRAMPLPTSSHAQAGSGNSAAAWGLGFMGNWWTAPAAERASGSPRRSPPTRAEEGEGEEDFQLGEDGTPMNFVDTPPALALDPASSGLLGIPPTTATASGIIGATASSTRESSPFSADLEAAADADSTSASGITSQEAREADEAQIGVAITTAAPIPMPAPMPTPVRAGVLASSLSAPLLAPLMAMSVPRQPIGVTSECPSSNPYQLRKSLIHSRTSTTLPGVPEMPPSGAGQVSADAPPAPAPASLPTSTSILSPLDRLTRGPPRPPTKPTTTTQTQTRTQEEASSDGSAIGLSPLAPLPLSPTHAHAPAQLLPISPRHLAPVGALRLAPETYSPPSPTDSTHASPLSAVPLPLVPYNTISSSTTTTGHMDTPLSEEGSFPFPFDRDSVTPSGSGSGSSLRRPSSLVPPPPPQEKGTYTAEDTFPHLVHRLSAIATLQQAPPAPPASVASASSRSASPSTSGATPANLPNLPDREAAGAEQGVIEGAFTSLPRPPPAPGPPLVAVAPPRPQARTSLPRTMWILGWIMPWCWIIGGWALAPPVVALPKGDLHLESGAMIAGQEVRGGWKGKGWIDHPDPWVRSCRICAVVVLPTVAVGAVAAVIVLAILR